MPVDTYDDILGKIFGKWRVSRIVFSGPWPWAWLVHTDNPNTQARMSVKSIRAGALG